MTSRVDASSVRSDEPQSPTSDAARYHDTLALLVARSGRAGHVLTIEAVYRAREDAQLAVHIANRLMAQHAWDSPVRVAAQLALDAAMVDLHKAKWRLGTRDGTYTDFVEPCTDVNLGSVQAQFVEVTQRFITIAHACHEGVSVSTPNPPSLRSNGTEILFADEAPLVPSVCPVVVLSGSNYDMGRQYAKQVVQIYGPWIFDRLAQRNISADDRSILERWTTELQEAMPEILQFARGWSEGAQECGIPLTPEHAIAIWTGYRAPATRPIMFGEDLDNTGDLGVRSYLGSRGQLDEISEADLCSGVCAWGHATVNGRLVAGATTDHECTFQATIVAYPADGHNFIYTPFSVNGSTPILGRQFMAGHPGFNDQGVAYVQHGGVSLDGSSCGGGPVSEWGYGVRRGASTFHALQFANTAAQARDMMLKLPVGDPGAVLGTAGGMFADDHYGVVIEERAGSPDLPTPILREVTYDGDGRSFDFLYANNNALSPDIGAWASPHEGNFRYTLEGGWYILRPEDAGTANPALQAARMSTKNSAGRNRYLYRTMMAGYGNIDVNYIRAVYRQSGSMPDGKYEDVVADWRKGQEWDNSSAHRGNAFTAVIEPSATSPGSYHACIGPAARFVQVREPSHGYYYHDETNAFWTLRLAQTPDELMDLAGMEAMSRIRRAQDLLERVPDEHPGRARLATLMEQARNENADGHVQTVPVGAGIAVTDEAIADVARRTRAFTRAQVRASQVIETLVPPEHDTADLLHSPRAHNENAY